MKQEVVIIPGEETKMKKLSTFPVPEWGFVHAIEQGNLDEFFPFLRADILDWVYRIKEWWAS